MSEYQVYEFVALDAPLSGAQQRALRAISTRAEITATRFWNSYDYGDLKADPAKLLARYFDAHLHHANWGTHRLMLRLPKAQIDVRALAAYFDDGGAARMSKAGANVVLDLFSDTEEYEDLTDWSLADLVALRSELLRGDLRPAYLAWLLAVADEATDEDVLEPPVPAGLGQLTAAQVAMIDFLRIDPALVAVAARASARMMEGGAPFRRWVAALSAKDKAAWLGRAAADPDLALGGELLRVYRATQKEGRSRARRSVGQLRKLAERYRT